MDVDDEFLVTIVLVKKDCIQRAVDRAGGLAAVTEDHDSESVVRSRSRTRRDTMPEHVT